MENGDFDTAEAAHLRRRALNPHGTAEAFRVEDDLKATAEERKAAQGRRVAAPSR